MSKFETKIEEILRRENIYFIREKTFQDLKKGKYRFDFYLPDQGILIEADGAQHFYQVPIFQKNRSDFLKTQGHDMRKNSYALSHNIPLYRIPFWEEASLSCFKDLLKEQNLVKVQQHNPLRWRQHQKDIA